MENISPDDGNDQVWTPQNNEGYGIPPSAAWERESGDNKTQQPYGAQATLGSDALPTSWSDQEYASTDPSFVTYHEFHGHQQPTATAYSPDGRSSNPWRGSPIMQGRRIISPGREYGMPGNRQYNNQSTASYHVNAYHPTIGGHEDISSYTAQPAPLSTSGAGTLNNYDASIASMPSSPSNNLQYSSTAGRQTGDEYSVACPHGCGTVLTGVHALGNLTRHLKSQTCAESGRAKVRAKVKYPCPNAGCDRAYTRSDGLRVHLRKRHGAPPAPPKNEGDEE